MTKALGKAIMKRLELENSIYEKSIYENLKSYKKQRNFCSKLYKKKGKTIMKGLILKM